MDKRCPLGLICPAGLARFSKTATRGQNATKINIVITWLQPARLLRIQVARWRNIEIIVINIHLGNRNQPGSCNQILGCIHLQYKRFAVAFAIWDFCFVFELKIKCYPYTLTLQMNSPFKIRQMLDVGLMWSSRLCTMYVVFSWPKCVFNLLLLVCEAIR